MQTKRKLNFPAAMAVIVLTILITACRTTPRVEYIHEMPGIVFPVFPLPDCVVYDEASDMVSMPLWYWQKIAEYKIDVDAVRDYLTLLRAAANPVKAGSK